MQAISCRAQSPALPFESFAMIQPTNLWRKGAEFLALKRNTSLLLIALVLAGTGERLWLAYVPKYLEALTQNEHLSRSAGNFIIGLFDALQTLLGALYAYPGGWLTDRWGMRRSLMLFSALSLAGYALVLAWHHWLALLLGAFLFLAWSALSLPTTFSVVATSLQSHRHTMGIGIQSMVRRIPRMVGPLAGGWLIALYGLQRGVEFALLICIVLSVVTMAFQWLMMEPAGTDAGRASGVAKVAANFFQVVRSFTPALRELLVSDILIRFCERIPYAFVILWAMDHVGVGAEQFGYLVAFEMIAAMFCYIPVAHL